MNKEKTTWDVLSSINCSEFTEKKNGLTYLSWAHAWGYTKKNFPSANYEITMWDGKPYLFDPDLGYFVHTKVTIEGETIGMQLPVMDGANKAQKNHPYTYQVNQWVNGQKVKVDKTVEPATMFDINTAIMRCLTKNLAMFGLGHYIYAGEDMPQLDDDSDKGAEPAENSKQVKEPKTAKVVQKPLPTEREEDPDMIVAKQEVAEAKSVTDLIKVYERWVKFQKDTSFLETMSERKKTLLKNA